MRGTVVAADIAAVGGVDRAALLAWLEPHANPREVVSVTVTTRGDVYAVLAQPRATYTMRSRGRVPVMSRRAVKLDAAGQPPVGPWLAALTAARRP